MKVTICLFVLGFGLCLAASTTRAPWTTPAPPTTTAQQCDHDNDCAIDECCYKELMVSKRQGTFEGYPLRPMDRKGACLKYRMEGEMCGSFDLWNGKCGCNTKLNVTCKHQTNGEVEHNVCVSETDSSARVQTTVPPPPKTTAKQCDHDNECNVDECCLKEPLMVSKRQGTFEGYPVGPKERKGACSKYTMEGDMCDMFDHWHGKCGCNTKLNVTCIHQINGEVGNNMCVSQ